MDFLGFRTSFSRAGRSNSLVGSLVGIFVGLLAVGCSQGSDIQLQGLKPTPPGSPVTPGDQTENPSSPKDPLNPGGTTPPTRTPVPPRPLTIRYRMLCDDRYPPYLNAISSMASPSGFGAGLETGELDALGKFDPINDRNLESHQSPQIVSLPSFGTARVLFSARRMVSRGGGSSPINASKRFVFIADEDITNRGGVATYVASEIPVASSVQAAAQSETLSVRTFGVSDEGRYLLIGTKDGYDLRDSSTLQSIGVLKVGHAGENVNPSLRESDMIFSVSNLKGAGFETRLYSLGLAIDGKLKSSTLITTGLSLRRPLVQVSKAAGDTFAAINSAGKIVTVSPLKRAGVMSVVKIAALPAKGRLSSAAAFWRDAVSGETHAAIAFENIKAVSGGLTTRYKIEQVFIRVLDVNESSLSADALTPDFDYPAEARQTIESGIGVGPVPGVSEMKASPDGKAVFGLFPGGLSKQIYRLNAFSLDRVSQSECANLSIGVEK
jgi:hypothetical protein